MKDYWLCEHLGICQRICNICIFKVFLSLTSYWIMQNCACWVLSYQSYLICCCTRGMANFLTAFRKAVWPSYSGTSYASLAQQGPPGYPSFLELASYCCTCYKMQNKEAVQLLLRRKCKSSGRVKHPSRGKKATNIANTGLSFPVQFLQERYA